MTRHSEAVRVAVGLRLGLDLFVPHEYYCGSMVDARGVHSFVCKRAPGRTARHHALNNNNNNQYIYKQRQSHAMSQRRWLATAVIFRPSGVSLGFAET